MSELYGFVEDAIKSPLNNSTIIFGQWLGYETNNLTPPFDFKLIQYRDFSIVGEWKIEAISRYSGKNSIAKHSLTVKPLHENQQFEKHDMFFSDNLLVDFRFVSTNINSDYSPKIAMYKNSNNTTKYGLLLQKKGKEEILTVASKFPNDLIMDNILSFNSIDFNSLEMQKITLKIKNNVFSITNESPLEIKFDYDNVLLLKDFIDVVQPIRSFIMNSSNEHHYTKQYKKRDMKKNFEPAIEVKAGSVRTFLSPVQHNDNQLDLFTEQDYGYKLLYSSLEYAEKRDSTSLVSLLNANNLTNLKSYLNHLLKVSKGIQGTEKLSIHYSNLQPLVLTNNSVSNINKAISEVKPNNIEISGMLYAIDTLRKWFKVYDAENKLDWKFVYKNIQFNEDIFTVNNFVKVLGETEIPIESNRGTAILETIELIQPKAKKSPEDYLKSSDIS